MDAKYIGKAVNLPHAAHEALEAVRQELGEKLGFTPSLTETISYLVAQYNKSKEGANGNR